MIQPLFLCSVPGILAGVALSTGRWSAASPGWYDVLRTVMMVLGGLVVIAIVLVVAVAIVSGVLGMIGRLRKRP